MKASSGELLFANTVYNATFANRLPAVGRVGDRYLQAAIRPVASHSDALILAGSSAVVIEHPALNIDGRDVVLETAKICMADCGHPCIRILGITRVLRFVSMAKRKSIHLTEQWTMYSSLSAEDQTITTMLATGAKIQEIADCVGRSKKTVETRRAVILSMLDCENVAKLAHLVCRFHDHGYQDFGI